MGNLTKSQHTGAKQWDENRQQGRGIFAAPPSTLAIADRPSSATAASDKMQMIRDEQRAAEKPVVYGCQTREEWLPGWLGVEVVAALAELHALWGDEPRFTVVRVFPRNISTGSFGEIWAAQLAASIEAKTPDKIADTNPVKNRPISDIPSQIEAVSADKNPVKPHAVQVEEKIAGTIKARGTERLDELVEAVIDGLGHRERANKYGVLPLFDDYWLRWGRETIHLEHVKLINGVIVSEIVGDDKTINTTTRGYIHDFMVKVHNAPAISAAERSARLSLKNLTESAEALEAVKPAPAAAKPYIPPTAKSPRPGYPAWLVREYAGTALETL